MSVTYEMKNIVRDISEIPEGWIYKKYYKGFANPLLDVHHSAINQRFDGRIIKVRSLKNNDSNPSLCFFYKNGHYYWKDFSSGQGGDVIEFVARLLSKTRTVTISKIVSDYVKFLDDGGEFELPKIENLNIEKAKFAAHVCKHTHDSLHFWHEGKVTLRTLNHFGIKYHANYSIEKGSKTTIMGGFYFGFYNKNGLYQLYDPTNRDSKYICIDPKYIIGSEQQTYQHNTCAIVSGQKDLAAIHEIGLDVDFIAPPNGEGSLLSYEFITDLQSRYSNILTIFDNDKAGIKAMMKYKAIYDIDFVHLKLEQDLFKNNIRYDKDYLKALYGFEINKKINND